MQKIILTLASLIMLAGDVLASSYTVKISPDHMRYADVVAQIQPIDGRVSLSRNGRDTGLYHGWATFVHEIEAFDIHNDPISLEYVTGGHWQLESHDGGPVTVRYRMLLQHDRFPNDPGDDELAWARDWGVMWTGRALFLEGADAGEISVEFDVTAEWKVSTPWRRKNREQWAFLAPDNDALLDSAFVAGTHEEVIIGELESPYAILALGGGAADSAALISGLVGTSMDGFTELFGAPPSAQMLLIAVDGSFWGGGVMGNTISLMQGGPLDENTTPMLAYITTHEMFHLWNSNFPIASVSDSDALQWFSEGSAEYYTWLHAVRGGRVDEQTFLAELANRHGQYMAARGDLTISAAGTVKLDHYDLIYSGGMMATAALDLTIRAKSSGSKSMDDVLRLLQARYPASADSAFAAAGFPALVKEATGVDVREIFDRYIMGNEALPMAEIFQLAGLRLSQGTDTAVYKLSREEEPARAQLVVRDSLLSGRK